MSNAPRPEPAPLAPPPLAPPRRDAPFRGIGLILLASIFLSSGDVASKLLTVSLPPMQVTWLRYGTFSLIMLALAFRSGGLSRLRTRRRALQFLRGFAVTASSVLFISGLPYLAIADATATSFVAPIFVTALSIPILGETIGWRRWAATITGLVGVLIVVRPGSSGFHSASLLPVASAFAWALSLIITRMMSRTENPLATLTYSALVGFGLVSLAVPFDWKPLTLEPVLIGVFIGASSTVGHWFVVLAFRHAEASLLAPFSYVQLVWAALFGYLLFAALPDALTLAGAVVIAGSGLYTAHRERIRARQFA